MFFSGRTKKKSTTKDKITLKLPMIRGRYDAAMTTPDNQNHWSLADNLGPNLAASPLVRSTIRNRSRYEFENNSYLSGIIETLADYQVGIGPRLQMQTGQTEEDQIVEELFQEWAEEIDFAGKLWTMRVGMAVDGEAFAVLITNPKLKSKVKLDLRLIEPEMVATPLEKAGDERIYDGIESDVYGNVVAYHILSEHPNDAVALSGASLKSQRYPANRVIHWYKKRRAGQKRGVSETAPCLSVLANLRRYAAAVLAAAETAAELAMVIYTDAPAGGESADLEAMDMVSLEKRMATVLPEGWKLGQMQGEQPATGYAEYITEKLKEVSRAFSMPSNIAMGDSSRHNYASGRLDCQAFYRRNRVAQRQMMREVLDKIFDAWVMEAVLIEDYIPMAIKVLNRYKHTWFFDGNEHVDPVKEATAQDIHLKNGTSTYAEEYARRGEDYRTNFEQASKEKYERIKIDKEIMERMGISYEDIERYRMIEDTIKRGQK